MTTEFLPFLDEVLKLFKINMTVYGYTFSFWDIYIFSTVGALLVFFIGGFLHD